MKWKYKIDPKTGLKILVSKKDPKALDNIRKMADEFFLDKEH